MNRISPRVDFAFKKLFGSEENKDLLIDFINSVVSEDDKVFDLTIKNPYNSQNFKEDKLSILDVKAKDSKGRWFNVEMQIVDQDYYAQRALYYWSRLYVSQLTSGINYDLLKKTISINILNFNCLDEEEEYHNTYSLRNVNSNKEFLSHLEIHFIELEKYDERFISVLDRWVNFLKKADFYTESMIPDELAEVSTIKKAIKKLDEMSLNSEEREVYEARLKWLRDEEMAVKTAERKGIEKGRKEGIEKGRKEGIEEGKIEVAINLLDILDDETISRKTEIPIEEVKEIREKNKKM